MSGTLLEVCGLVKILKQLIDAHWALWDWSPHRSCKGCSQIDGGVKGQATSEGLELLRRTLRKILLLLRHVKEETEQAGADREPEIEPAAKALLALLKNRLVGERYTQAATGRNIAQAQDNSSAPVDVSMLKQHESE